MRSMAASAAANPTAATAPPLICTIGAAAVLEDAPLAEEVVEVVVWFDEELPVDEGEEPDETTDVALLVVAEVAAVWTEPDAFDDTEDVELLAVPQEAAEGRFVTPLAEQSCWAYFTVATIQDPSALRVWYPKILLCTRDLRGHRSFGKIVWARLEKALVIITTHLADLLRHKPWQHSKWHQWWKTLPSRCIWHPDYNLRATNFRRSFAIGTSS
jgi:hypothetical protein